MLDAMGMKLLINHNTTPITISVMTIVINGILFTLLQLQVAIRCPIAGTVRLFSQGPCVPESGG
jgi:hypothetical protein